MRSVFWEDSVKELPRKSAQTETGSLVCEKPLDSQDMPAAVKSRSLPPILEDFLDFLKGCYGIKPSST
ncbi:MAG: hypothetical protein LBH16_08730 [Treponema sp.]|nr:hypothetical protein [Treponema sp.]